MPVFDVNGNIIGLDQDSYTSNNDGVQGARNTSIVLYNSGGPVLSSGIPSQQSFDRLRSLQGKGTATATITATVTGDMALACASGLMKTVMPGQPIKLTNPIEYVYVSQFYVPSATGTSIPLQSPVVSGGQTLALWEVYFPNGPGSSAIQPIGILPMSQIIADQIGANYYMTRAATADNLAPQGTQIVAAGGFTGANFERMRSPNKFMPFNAQAVTASSANTPTSIWTPAAGKKFRLMGYWFSTTAAAGLIFHDLASVGSGGIIPLPSPVAEANKEIKSPQNLGNGFLSAAANNQLWIDATIATTLTGFCWGTEE